MKSRTGRRMLVVALAVSAIAHVALMIAMRPQVMTRYASAIRRVIPRKALATRDATPPPETVEAVGDFASLKEAPEASAGALLPRDSSPDATASESPLAPVPPDPSMLIPMDSVFEVAPKLSESAPDADVPSFVHLRDDEPVSGLAPPMEDICEVAPLPEAADAMPEPLPPPMVLPAPEPDSFAPPTVDDAKKSDIESFVPPEEVMKEVDESVVAAEKDAVRSLLDDAKSRDLAEFTSVGVNSAARGEWSYFRVSVRPKHSAGESLKVVPKDVVILLDASGSIAKDRLRSCRAAAKEILRTCLNTDDRFNIVAFREKYSYAFRTWQVCDRDSFDAADSWMDRLAAHGRTDVFATISSVLTLPRDPKRPLIALVVTDGDANSGVSETASILSKFTALNDGLVSVYMYGVRGSANRELIDVLTRGNRGESFIYDGDRKNAGSWIGRLSDRFRDPVLSDLRVVFTAASRAEAFPQRLKNLYRGGCVEIVGRVPKGTREVSFSLRGLNGSVPYEGFFKLNLSDGKFDERLPDAWDAERAVDSKLNEAN